MLGLRRQLVDHLLSMLGLRRQLVDHLLSMLGLRRQLVDHLLSMLGLRRQLVDHLLSMFEFGFQLVDHLLSMLGLRRQLVDHLLSMLGLRRQLVDHLLSMFEFGFQLVDYLLLLLDENQPLDPVSQCTEQATNSCGPISVISRFKKARGCGWKSRSNSYDAETMAVFKLEYLVVIPQLIKESPDPETFPPFSRVVQKDDSTVGDFGYP